jgi:hypothetical protein
MVPIKTDLALSLPAMMSLHEVIEILGIAQAHVDA